MKTLFAKDIKAGQDISDEVFGLKSLKKGVTKDGKPYCDVVLTDKTGAIKGKIWSESIDSCSDVKEGDVVRVFGKVSSFNNLPQITVSAMGVADSFEPSDIIQSSEHSIDGMRDELKSAISEIKEPHLKELMKNIFTDDFFKEFTESPAAYTIHHAYRGGLAEHTLDILSMAKVLSERYPKLNRDLLYVGAILHDVGKLAEFNLDTTISMTTKGKLLGHIYIGTEFVQSKAPKNMPEELLNEVLHMILAHQGTLEFGSPVMPKTPEAVALSALDDASFKVNTVYHAIYSNEFEGDFSPFQRHLGTDLYRSSYFREAEDDI